MGFPPGLESLFGGSGIEIDTGDAPKQNHIDMLSDQLEKVVEDAKRGYLQSIDWPQTQTEDLDELRETMKVEAQALIYAAQGNGHEIVFAAIGIGIALADNKDETAGRIWGQLFEDDNREFCLMVAARIAAGNKAVTEALDAFLKASAG